jgi:hypothetical protein
LLEIAHLGLVDGRIIGRRIEALESDWDDVFD